eukprot:768590-Hanusia_phi.AAC.26
MSALRSGQEHLPKVCIIDLDRTVSSAVRERSNFSTMPAAVECLCCRGDFPAISSCWGVRSERQQRPIRHPACRHSSDPNKLEGQGEEQDATPRSALSCM